MARDGDKTGLVIFDSHRLCAESTAALVKNAPGFDVRAVTWDPSSLLSAVRKHRPSLVTADLPLLADDPFGMIRELRNGYRSMRVLVLTSSPEEVFADRCLKAGANGYLMKDASFEGLLEAIDTVLAGDVFVSSAVSRKLVATAARIEHEGGARKYAYFDQLSDRELHVFTLIGVGRSSREIAGSMGVGRKTIDTYKERIKKKLGIRNAVELSQAAADFLDWQI